MLYKYTQVLKSCLLLLLLASLAACSGSPKTSYHTLGGAGDIPASAVKTGAGQRITSLGVGPVKLPSLLDRKAMVLRKDTFTVDVSDLHEWGGELEDEFLTALAERLQVLLPNTRIQNIPWELEQTPQLQVSLTVTQFDGMPAGKAILKGNWQVQRANTGGAVANQAFDLQRPVESTEVDAVVKAQSGLVSDLAAQIVGRLGN